MEQQIYPPENLLERIANDPSQNNFINSFEYVRSDVKQYLKQSGLDFANFNNILDLGCGVGRFLFAFEKEIGANQKLYGCDVFEECAKWCQENIHFAETSHTSIEPPLPYEDGKFDFVYALSVFTHLRLEMQFKWAWEIHRVLRPGGIFFVTTHGPIFIPLLHSFSEYASREMFTLGEEGLFAHISFSGKDDDEGQVHVAAAQSIGFFKEQFSAFDLVKIFPKSNLAGEQDLYLIRKPEHGRPIARPLANETALDVEQWFWKGQIREDETIAPVSLPFLLKGQRKFHVYPRIVTPAFCALDIQIQVKTDHEVLVSQRIPLNNTRVFGKTHYAKIEIDVPEYTGEVDVEMCCLPRGVESSPNDAMEVEWSFPNFT